MRPAVRGFASVRNFDVLTHDNYAGPLVVPPNFIDLHANQWIQPHPLNFAADGGEATQTVGIVREIKGNDIGPVVGSTRESAIAQASEHFAAFPTTHLGNQHGRSKPRFTGALGSKSTSLGFMAARTDCRGTCQTIRAG